jgi:hypothetical protein
MSTFGFFFFFFLCSLFSVSDGVSGCSVSVLHATMYVSDFLFLSLCPMRFLICWLLSLVTHVLSAGFLFFLTNNKYNIMSHLSY